MDPHCKHHYSEYVQFKKSCWSSPLCSNQKERNNYCPIKTSENWILPFIKKLRKKMKRLVFYFTYILIPLAKLNYFTKESLTNLSFDLFIGSVKIIKIKNQLSNY